MNCERAERDILLASSGELSKARGARLERHLAGCETCAAYRRDIEQVADVAATALAGGGPSGSVMEAIRCEAASRPRRGVLLFPKPVVQALAYAAALVVILGGFLLVTSDREIERIQGMSALVSMVSESPDSEAAGVPAGADEEEELRALAQQLLQIEGFEDDFPVIDQWVDPDGYSPSSV